MIPTYNSADHIDPLLERLVPILENTELSWQVLFVDDFSSDGTFAQLRRLHRNDQRIRAVRLSENRGQQNAVYCGICEMQSEWVVTMDDDLQHPPELIPELIERISGKYDLVYAVERSTDRSLPLRLGTALNGLFFSLFLGKPPHLELGSYRIFSKSLIKRLQGEKRDFLYVSALVFLLRPKVPITSFRFSHETGKKQCVSRYSHASRCRLFFRLFLHFGALRFLRKQHGNPYTIGEKL